MNTYDVSSNDEILAGFNIIIPGCQLVLLTHTIYNDPKDNISVYAVKTLVCGKEQFNLFFLPYNIKNKQRTNQTCITTHSQDIF